MRYQGLNSHPYNEGCVSSHLRRNEDKNLIAFAWMHAGIQAKAICRYMSEVKLFTSADLDDLQKIQAFKDVILASVSKSSAKTYFAAFRAFIAKYYPSKVLNVERLKSAAPKPLKIALTRQELEALEHVRTRKIEEIQVLYTFLVSAWTGLRISDALRLTPANLNADGNFLTYVSKKTHVKATVPLRAGVASWLFKLQEMQCSELSTAGYNKIIRRLCRRAGIRTTCKVFSAGKELIGEKWSFVSSHTARITFCTRLANSGVSLYEIAQMAGHTNVSMTERYIVRDAIELSDKAVNFFHG